MTTKEIIEELEKITDLNQLKIISSTLMVHMDSIREPRNGAKTWNTEDVSD